MKKDLYALRSELAMKKSRTGIPFRQREAVRRHRSTDGPTGTPKVHPASGTVGPRSGTYESPSAPKLIVGERHRHLVEYRYADDVRWRTTLVGSLENLLSERGYRRTVGNL